MHHGTSIGCSRTVADDCLDCYLPVQILRKAQNTNKAGCAEVRVQRLGRWLVCFWLSSCSLSWQCRCRTSCKAAVLHMSLGPAYTDRQMTLISLTFSFINLLCLLKGLLLFPVQMVVTSPSQHGHSQGGSSSVQASPRGAAKLFLALCPALPWPCELGTAAAAVGTTWWAAASITVRT